MLTYAQIILPLNLSGTFTYTVPEDLVKKLQPGMRVLVPFRGKKIYTGIVFGIHQQKPETFVPRELISLLDEQPILPSEQLKFWNWLSEYYLCNLGEIYRFAFPASLKLESETYLKLKPNAVIKLEQLEVNELYLIQALEVRQVINLTDIEAFIPKKDIIRTINSLIDLQYIEIDEKIKEKYKAREVAYVQINRDRVTPESLPEVLSLLKRSPKQQELFLHILHEETETGVPIKKSDLFSDAHFAYAQLKGLAEKGLVTEHVQQEDRLDQYAGEQEELEPLTPSQLEALAEITGAFKEDKNVLLHGITSSGKTHLYAEKIEEIAAQGKNVLLLLPEIALTKQIVRRLEKKYGTQLGYYHQKLTDFERVEVWRKVHNNEIRILIGTRNALFLPFTNLGLVVVDEEHDTAYKPREVNPYFNARDAAQVLAKYYGAHVILGSATPSVETYYAARKGVLHYVYLGERYGKVAVPKFELIDFKEEQDAKTVFGSFSQPLIKSIQQELDEQKQTMVLHNRRGYANVVECESCGHVTYCSNCDVVMTYHKSSNEMKCHYCGHKAAKPAICPRCHSENLNVRGVGVEQIHEEAERLFPDAEVDRMDVDSMRRKYAYEKLYEKLEKGETDILVGTQMIAKGLDFENIELVAVPRADSMLYVQDFRAEERAYQLLTQVAGRAGRVSGKGRVLVQTFNPQHQVFQLLKEQNVEALYDHMLEERKKFHYPPFVKLILIELKHRREDKVNRAAQFMGSVLRKYLPEECVLGPEKAPIARLNLMYQYQLMLKLPRGKKYPEYKKLVLKSFEEFEEVIAYQSIKRSVYVDF